MEPNQHLSAPEYWKMTPIIIEKAVSGMNNRAETEINQVNESSGEDLSQVHGEAIKNYQEYSKIILGGLDLLEILKLKKQGLVAADLGSGTGVGAAIISQDPAIAKVYAIEYSEKFVTHIMPVVFQRFHARQEKIQRVVGDFNNLQFPDETLDLIIEIDSYHHSEDLPLSAREAFRVLKPGGAIIAQDRAWPDETPQEELEAKLDLEFSPALKKKYGVPEGQRFTRRDFGEHEYTRAHWERVFAEAGFQTFILNQEHPKIPGLNFLILKLNLPALAWSLKTAANDFLHGQKRSTLYGWDKTKHLLVFIKPATAIS